MTQLSFEDFFLGRIFKPDAFMIDADEMKQFARDYDPQTFHLNEDTAQQSFSGQLVAPGWFTCSLLVREFTRGFLKNSTICCGAGMKELRWLKPIFPGDILRSRAVVIESRESRMRPELGIVTLEGNLINQNDEIVMSNIVIIMMGRRGEDVHPDMSGSSSGKAEISIPSEFPGIIPLTFFEDIQIGGSCDIGSYTFTDEAIKKYATLYDPQPFHVDEKLAQKSFLGGLCSSGIHSALIWCTLSVQNHNNEIEKACQKGNDVPQLGVSPGFHRLSWYLPVYSGDTLIYSTKILRKHQIPHKKGWGLIEMKASARNQFGDNVLEYYPYVIVESRIKAH